MTGNTFYLQGFDGDKDHTIEVSVSSQEKDLILKKKGYRTLKNFE